MTTELWFALALLLTCVLVWAYTTAQRLDRLHIRLDRSRDALQSALDRRCAVIAATVPEVSEQARAVEQIRFSPLDVQSRCDAEGVLRRDVDTRDAARDHGRDLVEADVRVMLALRFYNEAVSDTRALRLRLPVRILRLGGTAALPEYAHLSTAG